MSELKKLLFAGALLLLFTAFFFVEILPASHAREQPQPQSGLSPEKMTGTIRESIFDLINEERGRHGLKPLRLDQKLSTVAEGHSRDMASSGHLSHVSSDWKTYLQRLFDSEILYQKGGENVAFSETFVPEIIHQSLMDSKGHREQILKADYDSVGLGVAYSRAKKGYYVTQDFILSLTLRPVGKGEAYLRKKINRLRLSGSTKSLKFLSEFDRKAREYAETLARLKSPAPRPRLWGNAYIVHLSSPALEPEELITQILLSDRFDKAGLGLHFGRTELYPGGVHNIVVFLFSRNLFWGASKKELRTYVLGRLNETRRKKGFGTLKLRRLLNRKAAKVQKRTERKKTIPPDPKQKYPIVYMLYETESPDVLPESLLDQILQPGMRFVGIAVRADYSKANPLGLYFVALALSQM